MNSSYRAMKRIRLELDSFQSHATHSGTDDHWRPSSPVKGLPRTPQRTSTMVCIFAYPYVHGLITTLIQTREAQDRMNEMRQLIGKRLDGEMTPRGRAGTLPSSSTQRPADTHAADKTASSLQEIVSEADEHLARATSNYDKLQGGLDLLVSDLKEVREIL